MFEDEKRIRNSYTNHELTTSTKNLYDIVKCLSDTNKREPTHYNVERTYENKFNYYS